MLQLYSVLDEAPVHWREWNVHQSTGPGLAVWEGEAMISKDEDRRCLSCWRDREEEAASPEGAGPRPGGRFADGSSNDCEAGRRFAVPGAGAGAGGSWSSFQWSE